MFNNNTILLHVLVNKVCQ